MSCDDRIHAPSPALLWALEQRSRPTAKLVLLELACDADPRGRVALDVTGLVRRLGRCRSGVLAAVAHLEAEGLVRRLHRRTLSGGDAPSLIVLAMPNAAADLDGWNEPFLLKASSVRKKALRSRKTPHTPPSVRISEHPQPAGVSEVRTPPDVVSFARAEPPASDRRESRFSSLSDELGDAAGFSALWSVWVPMPNEKRSFAEKAWRNLSDAERAEAVLAIVAIRADRRDRGYLGHWLKMRGWRRLAPTPDSAASSVRDGLFVPRFGPDRRETAEWQALVATGHKPGLANWSAVHRCEGWFVAGGQLSAMRDRLKKPHPIVVETRSLGATTLKTLCSSLHAGRAQLYDGAPLTPYLAGQGGVRSLAQRLRIAAMSELPRPIGLGPELTSLIEAEQDRRDAMERCFSPLAILRAAQREREPFESCWHAYHLFASSDLCLDRPTWRFAREGLGDHMPLPRPGVDLGRDGWVTGAQRDASPQVELKSAAATE